MEIKIMGDILEVTIPKGDSVTRHRVLHFLNNGSKN